MSEEGIKAEVYKEEDPREKQIRIWKSEIKQLEEILKSHSDRVQIYEGRINLIDGVKLGLMYGIFGSVFVQSFFSLAEGLALVKYDLVFWFYVVVFAISSLVIIAVTVRFRSQKKNEIKSIRISLEGQTMFKSLIEYRKKGIESLESAEQKKAID